MAPASVDGFERVHLKAGETTTVELYPAMDDLSQVDEQGERHALAGEYTFQFGVQHEVGPSMAFLQHKVMTV